MKNVVQSPLSIAVMSEKLGWLGHFLRMKDDRLFFSANRLGLNGNQVVHNWGDMMS